MKLTLTNSLTIAGAPLPFAQRLRQTLSLQNPKWLENKRMNRWNGSTPRVLTFYSDLKEGLRIPRGVTGQVVSLARRERIPLEIEDGRRTLPAVAFHFAGVLKPFQEAALQAMLAKDFGTLEAPTGSGKTVLACGLIAARRQPALVVVHTKELLHQWIERLETFLGIPEAEIGRIGDGQRRIGERVTVAIVNSLYPIALEVREQIGHLIVDECHRTPSRTFTEAVSPFDTAFMTGLTATPWRRDGLDSLIFWHLGDVQHRIAPETLVETGDILAAEVITRETDFATRRDPVLEYPQMIAELTGDADRNRLIAGDVTRAVRDGSGTCLVLTDRKEHCHALAALVRENGIHADILTGDSRDVERREIVERLNDGRVKVLVATGQLVGEGFDARNLSVLFLASPIKFDGRLIQYLGRVLRPAPGKRTARVYDYLDGQVAPLVASYRARRRVYEGREGRRG